MLQSSSKLVQHWRMRSTQSPGSQASSPWNFGEERKKDFERFMNNEELDNLDCHEIFNVLEHRARQSSLADVVVQYFDLPKPHNQRGEFFTHLITRFEDLASPYGTGAYAQDGGPRGIRKAVEKVAVDPEFVVRNKAGRAHLFVEWLPAKLSPELVTHIGKDTQDEPEDVPRMGLRACQESQMMISEQCVASPYGFTGLINHYPTQSFPPSFQPMATTRNGIVDSENGMVCGHLWQRVPEVIHVEISMFAGTRAQAGLPIRDNSSNPIEIPSRSPRDRWRVHVHDDEQVLGTGS
ncbi:hypothetical protein FHL15_006474 [Xylaria flabelliformis]|uniref:Uncharacterized protein n=1 Tax=Xylaria flabelliformis TaxID=2512241 RepID=A0A553HX82_9PEZI|nr:hypothetical protein FHL15_006474 [Xylaria flabelliformis]